MELKLKEAIEKRKNEDEAEKTRIEDDFCEELKKELDNFDFKNIKLKNGKYMYSNEFLYIHDNNLEYFDENNKKCYEGEFIQEVKGGEINIYFHGKGTDIEYNYKGEFFMTLKLEKVNF